MIQTVKISEVHPNPKNPRIIKNDKYKKLVSSIKDFPEMLKVRPIVVDPEGIILGGNMRYKAAIEAGLKEIPIMRVDWMTEDQIREFIIKDNSSYGEWDWDILSDENYWDLKELGEWGIDVPATFFDQDEEPEFDDDRLANRLDKYLNNTIKNISLLYPHEEYVKIIADFDLLKKNLGLEDKSQIVKHLIEEWKKSQE